MEGFDPSQLQWTVWGIVMAAVMGWLARSRSTATHIEDGTLAQPRSMLILAWVCGLFFATLAVLSSVYGGDDLEWWVPTTFIAFALLGFVMIADYYRSRHVMTPNGLQYGKLFGPGGSLEWRQVRRLRYSDTMKWFRIDLADGRVVRLSAMLAGLPRFALEALQQVRPEAIDEHTRLMLAATAHGKPPSIWK